MTDTSHTATAHPATNPEAPVATERHGPILVIRLQRPQARNALDLATAEAVHAAMDLLDKDDSLFVGVLTGSGAAGIPGNQFARGVCMCAHMVVSLSFARSFSFLSVCRVTTSIGNTPSSASRTLSSSSRCL